VKELGYMVEAQEWGYLAETGHQQACQEDKSWTDKERKCPGFSLLFLLMEPNLNLQIWERQYNMWSEPSGGQSRDSGGRLDQKTKS
jgi:hypothetical protein